MLKSLKRINLGQLLFLLLFVGVIFLGFHLLEKKVSANHCVTCCGANESYCALCDECLGPGNLPKTCSQQWCGGAPPPPPPCACVGPSAVVITAPANGSSGHDPDQLTVSWAPSPGVAINWGIDRGRIPNCSNNTTNDRFRLYYRKISGGTLDVPVSPPPYTVIINGYYRLDLPRTTFTYNLYNLHGASTYEIYVGVYNGCRETATSTRTAITALRPTPPPATVSNLPWLLTYGNNAHTGNFISNFPTVSISSILVGVNGTLITKTSGASYASTYTASTVGNQIPVRASANSFINLVYPDLNVTPPLSSEDTLFYDYLLRIAQSNTTLQQLAPSAFTNRITMSSVTGKAVGQAAHVLVSGSVTIQDPTPPRVFTCDTKSVVFIAGDLVVDPDLVAGGTDNGCIFVVKGKIRITNGDFKNLGNISGTSLTRYDRVDGFFVTDGSFTTYTDPATTSSSRWDGLVIKGGVLSPSPVFLRDLNNQFNLTQPAEAVVYDSRYVSVDEFRNVFQIKDYNIREEGFAR